MIEFLTENIKLDEIGSKEKFLKRVEEEVINMGFEFMILKINEFKVSKIKIIIEEIKRHFDIFIIIKTQIPESDKELEYYFSTGAHGVIFEENIKGNKNYKETFGLLIQATKIFSTGTIFYETFETDEKFILELIDKNIIPIVRSSNTALLDYIEMKLKKRKNLSTYLKYIPVIKQFDEEYAATNMKEKGLKQRLEKKFILELNNLRQKLMIKEVNDSFNSSSL